MDKVAFIHGYMSKQAEGELAGMFRTAKNDARSVFRNLQAKLIGPSKPQNYGALPEAQARSHVAQIDRIYNRLIKQDKKEAIKKRNQALAERARAKATRQFLIDLAGGKRDPRPGTKN